MKKLLVISLLALTICQLSFGQKNVVIREKNIVFAEKDTQKLAMDIYMCGDCGENYVKREETIIYVFGGGFLSGSKEEELAVTYCTQMAERGYTTIAIDYRLGMKGKNVSGVAFINAIEKSIRMATEDLSSAVAFLIKNGHVWGIDPDKIIITGCSAGAITCLQTDYCHARGSEWTKEIPENFRFAGVMAYAGAVFSREGKLDYTKHAPAPTLMYHGTEDKMVNYKGIQFGSLGFFGSSLVVKRFQKYEFPYYLRRFEGLKHEVAMFGNIYLDEQDWFIQNYIREARKWYLDETFRDKEYKTTGRWNGNMKDLMKQEQQNK